MANRDSLSYAAELEVLSKDEVRKEFILYSFFEGYKYISYKKMHDINICS